MDTDGLEYLGISRSLKGFTLEPTSSTYQSQSFYRGSSHDPLVINIGRLPSAAQSLATLDSPRSALYRCPVVSRKHARFTLSSGKITVQDLGSHHGTSFLSVTGRRNIPVLTDDPTELYDGATVTFGKPVSDLKGGFVYPVSVKVKYLFEEPTTSQSRFGLACLSESDSEPAADDRASSMDISSDAGSRSASPQLASSAGILSRLKTILPANPHAMIPSKRFSQHTPPGSYHDPSYGFADEDELHPNNQLGLNSELQPSTFQFDDDFNLSSSSDSEDEDEPSPAASSPDPPAKEGTPSTPVQSPSNVGFIGASFSPLNDPFENHAASLHSSSSFQVPQEDMEDGYTFDEAIRPEEETTQDGDQVQSTTALDSHPVTPDRRSGSVHSARGREQSPIDPSVEVGNQEGVDIATDEQSITVEQDPQESAPCQLPSTGSGERGIRAFFKAIGVVRPAPSSIPSSSTAALAFPHAASNPPAPMQQFDKEELKKDLCDFIPTAVRDELLKCMNGDVEEVRCLATNLKEGVSRHAIDVESSMNVALDGFRQTLSLESVKDIVRTELLADGIVTPLRQLLQEGDILDLKSTVNIEVRTAVELLREGIARDTARTSAKSLDSLRMQIDSLGEEVRSRADSNKSSVDTEIQDMKEEMQKLKQERDTEAELSKQCEKNIDALREQMEKEIEASKALVKGLQEQIERSKMDNVLIVDPPHSKRRFDSDSEEKEESEQPAKRVRLVSPQSSVIGSAVRTLVRSTVFAMVGGIGAWAGLAYL